MAGPALVIVAGFITLWIAISHPDPVLTDDYYKQGLTVNKVVDQYHAAANQGIKAQILRSGQELRIFASTKAGPLQSGALKFAIKNPAKPEQDQEITLENAGSGFYVGKLKQDVQGQRDVLLSDKAEIWIMAGKWQSDSQEPFNFIPTIK